LSSPEENREHGWNREYGNREMKDEVIKRQMGETDNPKVFSPLSCIWEV
jgi:hypothetical protein